MGSSRISRSVWLNEPSSARFNTNRGWDLERKRIRGVYFLVKDHYVLACKLFSRPPEGRKGVIVPGDEMVRLRDVRSTKLAARNAVPAPPPDVNAWFTAPSRGQKSKRVVDVVETTAEPTLAKVSDVTSRNCTWFNFF